MKIYKCHSTPDTNKPLSYRPCGNQYNCKLSYPTPRPCPKPPCHLPCSKVCQDQEGCQSQGDQNQDLGDLSATQGDQSQAQGDQTETQGDLSATQGDQSQAQGDQTETQGDLSATQGDQSQAQGDQTETQGDLSATQGDQSQAQGDQTETQGDLSATQGDQSQAQGDQTETQGDLSATQGDLTETLGDQAQIQGGEKQGDQTQGNQTQGDQTQTMTGHGGQTLGDQTLVSSPTISTPVNVSGVNLNVTVSCCDAHKKHDDDCKDCKVICKRTIMDLLNLIRTFALAVANPGASQIGFYADGLPNLPTNGSLGSVTDCIFTIVPESEGKDITVLIDTLGVLSFEAVDTTPSIFSLLLTYLQSASNTAEDGHDCCFEELQLQLQVYYTLGVELQINLASASFTGFIYKISDGIVYLVDDLMMPTVIHAIPICKILSYQPQ
ncbi:MAG: hypothetical protein ACK5L0_05240 [Candidatus Fimivivens sp.]